MGQGKRVESLTLSLKLQEACSFASTSNFFKSYSRLSS